MIHPMLDRILYFTASPLAREIERTKRLTDAIPDSVKAQFNAEIQARYDRQDQWREIQ